MQDKILIADRLDTMADFLRRGIRYPKGSLLVSTAATVIRELTAELDRLREHARAGHGGWRVP